MDIVNQVTFSCTDQEQDHTANFKTLWDFDYVGEFNSR